MSEKTPSPPPNGSEVRPDLEPCGAAAHDEFVHDVHSEELKYVRERRQAAGTDPGEVDPKGGPSTGNGLVGLAFSGGGIRSATFNLGILQALHRWGVLKRVDLLSTVSGGGFIGSSLTSQMSQGGGFPFDGEMPAVVHLRNNSNYLAPRGVLDYLRMFAVLIRGIILNFLVLVPFLLVPCLIATVIYGPLLLSRLEYDETTALAHRYLESAAVADGVEVEGGEGIKDLLATLKKRAFVSLGVAQNDRIISDALQEQNSSYREVTEPLIAGMGSESVPHTFLAGVTLRDVTQRLMDADLLKSSDAIEEVQAVELFLRSRGIGEESPRSLFEALSCQVPKGRCESAQEEIRPFMVLVSTDTLVSVLNKRKILDGKGGAGKCALPSRDAERREEPLAFLDECGFARLPDGTPYSLTQVLQAFYEERLYDRRWLEVHRSAAHDETLGYRWPNDASGHREIEAAAVELWSRLNSDWDPYRGLDISVEKLFEALESMGEPSVPKGSLSSMKLAKAETLEEPLLVKLDDRRKLLNALRFSGVVSGECAAEKGRRGSRPGPRSAAAAGKASPFTKQAGKGSPFGKKAAAEPAGKGSPFGKKAAAEPAGKGSPFGKKAAAEPAGKRSPFGKKAAAEPAAKRSPVGKQAAAGQLPGKAFPFPAGSAAKKTACSFDAALGPLQLPAILYKQQVYNKKWFEDRNPWREKPSELKYQSGKLTQDREIEAVRRALDLQPSQTVAQVLERIEKLRKRKELISARRGTPEAVFAALEGDELIEARGDDASLCSPQLPEGCFFTTGEAYQAIPKLLYERELFERDWFDNRWQENVAYLSGPAAAIKDLAKRCKRVQSLFLCFEKDPGILGGKNRRSKAFNHLLAQGFVTDRKVKPCGRRDKKECVFKDGRAEVALWELYDQGLFKKEWLEEYSASDTSFNLWFEQRAAEIMSSLSRVVREYEEETFWSPHELRMPLTGRVAILGLLWVLGYPLIVLLRRSLDGGKLRKGGGIERSLSIFMIAIAAVAFFELQPYLIYHWHYLDVGASWSLVVGAVSLVSTLAAGPALSFFKKFGRKIVIVVISCLGPLLPFMIYLFLMDSLIYANSWFAAIWPTRSGYDIDWWSLFLFFALAGLLFHLFLLAMDPNSTGIHNFYRDRLSEAYLVGSRTGDELVPEENLKLSDLGEGDKSVPYHLINVALNLQGSDQPDLRDRRSEFFLFSKYFVGGRYTGYCKTKDMESAVGELGVGTAMAVSGAAAAPNMGAFTVGPLVVLLALLNIRLGYWLPNPGKVPPLEKKDGWRSHLKWLPARLVGRYRLRPGPYLFLKELSSGMDEKGRFVNVSDGGHLENTAVFELLRRRCKFIIAGDAEADPRMNFAGLATLIRIARIDLNVEIDIDTRELRLRDGKSHRHATVGRITYPACPRHGADKEFGYLIYLKASVTGDEDEIVTEYRHRREKFPHESTADQFFDETQFEAYRALGFHVAQSFFAERGEEVLEEGAMLECLPRAAET